MDSDEEYYLDLTDVLYEYYDQDHDSALTLNEWQAFAKDILDQSEPQYQ